MDCWLCGENVDVEIIYESEFLGPVLGYRCPYCSHVGEIEQEGK